MKTWKLTKLIALLLTLVMITQVSPFTGWAEEQTIDPPEETTPEILSEIESLRDKNIKHFRLSDGTYIAAQYTYPVHYRKNGSWEDIDNRLVTDASGAITNEASDVDIAFGIRASDDGMVRVSHGGYEVSMGMKSVSAVNAQVNNDVHAGAPEDSMSEAMPENLFSSVTYKNIQPKIDLSYVVSPTGVKESIVLYQKQEQYVYRFPLNTDGLTATLQEDKSVDLRDDLGNVIFSITAPFMVDDDGARSNDIEVSLTQDDDGYILTLTPDAAWINDTDRVFPVVVDPSLEVGEYAIESQVYGASSPDQTYNDQNLYVGHTGDVMRTYLGFDMPNLPANVSITGATLRMTQVYGYNNSYGNYDPININVYEAPDEWTDEGKTWNNQPNCLQDTATSLDLEVIDYQPVI